MKINKIYIILCLYHFCDDGTAWLSLSSRDVYSAQLQTSPLFQFLIIISVRICSIVAFGVSKVIPIHSRLICPGQGFRLLQGKSFWFVLLQYKPASLLAIHTYQYSIYSHLFPKYRYYPLFILASCMLCETVVQQQLFTQSVAEKKPLQAALLRLGENWIANWSREPVFWDLGIWNFKLLAKKSTISSTAWKIVKRLNCPDSTISMLHTETSSPKVADTHTQK